MAILKNGLFGSVSGKIGNVVHYTLGGKMVVRIIGRNENPPTVRQLSSRQGMKVLNEFLKSMTWFIRIGFGPEAAERNMHPRNAAMSFNKKHALKGDYPNVEIDYAKVLLSRGGLSGLSGLLMQVRGNTEQGFSLEFNWAVLPEDKEWPGCIDTVMLLAYAPREESLGAEGEALAHFNLHGAERQAGMAVLKLPEAFAGRSIEVYITVVTQNREKIANSQYMGTHLLVVSL